MKQGHVLLARWTLHLQNRTMKEVTREEAIAMSEDF